MTISDLTIERYSIFDLNLFLCIKMTRSLLFVCVAALACMVSAAPKTSGAASSIASAISSVVSSVEASATASSVDASETSSASASSTKTSAVASSKTSPVAPTTSIMSGGGYNSQGLPASIFPDYSGIVYVDTDELDDGQQYLEDQNEGKLPE
ncbi:unnamed protein product [Mucor hiemalis]